MQRALWPRLSIFLKAVKGSWKNASWPEIYFEQRREGHFILAVILSFQPLGSSKAGHSLCYVSIYLCSKIATATQGTIQTSPMESVHRLLSFPGGWVSLRKSTLGFLWVTFHFDFKSIHLFCKSIWQCQIHIFTEQSTGLFAHTCCHF